MTPERFQRLKSCLTRRQPDLTVLADDVHKAHNVAAILRTADAVGIHGVHAVSPGGEFRHHHMVSGGSKKWVKVTLHDDVETAVAVLKQDGFRVVAAHPSSTGRDYREEDYTARLAVMLGAELDGFADSTLALADDCLSIPMEGMVSSLNVSVAAALILFEARRQREAAALYDDSRLDAAEYEATLFEWAYPELARKCRQHGRPYPGLSDDGDLLENPLKDVRRKQPVTD